MFSSKQRRIHIDMRGYSTCPKAVQIRAFNATAFSTCIFCKCLSNIPVTSMLFRYTHTYIHTYIHTHIHTYVPTYIHTYLVKFRLGIFGSCSVEFDMSNGTCPTKTNCQEPFQLWHNFICHRGDESCISPKDFQIQMPSFRPTFFYLICH